MPPPLRVRPADTKSICIAIKTFGNVLIVCGDLLTFRSLERKRVSVVAGNMDVQRACFGRAGFNVPRVVCNFSPYEKLERMMVVADLLTL